MTGYELEDWQERVRTVDPPESKEAARSVRAAKDRLLVLKAFRFLRLTARQAALICAEDGDSARIDSLRRRVSDLKKLGWIEQTGTTDGQALYDITDSGREAFRDSLATH